MSIRRGPTFSLKMTINYNQSICCRWADLSSSLTWPAWLSALHLGPGPSSVAPAFFRIGYQSSSLSLLWQSDRENIRNNFSPEGFCWRPSIASRTFTTIVADQLTALPGFEEMQILLKCHQFSRPGQFSWCCWDFLDYIWNLVSFRDLDNSHDRFGQFDIPLVDAFLRFRSGI